MTAHKRAFSHFQNIEVFVPAVAAFWTTGVQPDTSSEHLIAERTWLAQPPGWPDTVFDLLRELWLRSSVGRAVMRNVVRRTTIYHARVDGGQTWPDTVERYHGQQLNTADAYRAASDGHGWAAIIMIDSQRPARLEYGVFRHLRFTLLHELVHAVNITNGASRDRDDPSPERTSRCMQTDAAPTPEESFAWIVDNMYRYERRTLGRHQYDQSRAIPAGQLPNERTTGLQLGVIETNHVRYAEARVPLLAKDLRALTHLAYNPFRDRASRNPFAPPPQHPRRCV